MSTLAVHEHEQRQLLKPTVDQDGLDDDEGQNNETGSYTFDQLSNEAKEHARCKERDHQSEFMDNDWADDMYDDFVERAKDLGIQIGARQRRTMNDSIVSYPDIAWSGFSSQGDGACLTGHYSCEPNAVKKTANECPKDATLLSIATELTTIQTCFKMEHGDTISCNICRGGRYSHSGSMHLEDISIGDAFVPDDFDHRPLLDVLRRFADWIYRQLESQYDYLLSNECIDEQLCDGRLFDADGVII